jgi:3-deoxy-D-manno-octulosonic-acid transferase
VLTLYKIFTFLVYYIASPYTFLSFLFGSRKWGQRLGFRNCPITGDDKKVIWMHASSMGEVKVLSILADQLLELDSDLRFCITVMTAAGYKSAENRMGGKAPVAYFPLDYFSPVKRFLDRTNPSVAVFIETEIWPNMVMELGKRGIPIFLANGRLSERAARRYRRAKQGLRHVFANYSRIMVQTEGDRQRYLNVGAESDIIDVLGSLKFDAPLIQVPPEKKAALRKSLPFNTHARIITAGSTREGENEIILQLFARSYSDVPDMRLILVPRHLDRIEDICRKAEEYQLEYALYSRRTDLNSERTVLIVDAMGILNDLYAVSDIAFVGGTLVDIGGHNILEPVWAGIPVLYGPSIFNVRDSSEYILENNYGAMVQDGEELYHQLVDFFDKKVEYRRRTIESKELSRTYRTARIILNSIGSNGKNLAHHNKS